MNVDFSLAELVAQRVWYDASSGKLYIQAHDFVNAIPFHTIPDKDFESLAPVRSFSIGQNGSVVVCHHSDEKETWLPVDMWLPNGVAAA